MPLYKGDDYKEQNLKTSYTQNLHSQPLVLLLLLLKHHFDISEKKRRSFGL